MPVCGAYLAIVGLSTHRMHSLLPGAGEYLPRMQLVHVEADIGEKVPALHFRQKSPCVAPVVVENKPAAHCVHTACLTVV